jgi:hypothetical protein
MNTDHSAIFCLLLIQAFLESNLAKKKKKKQEEKKGQVSCGHSNMYGLYQWTIIRGGRQMSGLI